MRRLLQDIVSQRDDYARWRDDPMTRQVFAALRTAADAQKTAWDEASWGGGIARPDELDRTLRELRTRADAYQSIEELTFEQMCQWLGIEPDAD